LALYDDTFEGGLLKAHLEACQGKRLPPSQELVEFKGFRVILAEKDFKIFPAFEWPAWSSDQPVNDEVILTGEPLCTIHASAKDGAALEKLLTQRASEITTRLMGANPKDLSTNH
jgi:methenyltetrahydromethanopterin cyclohydrolase